MSKTGHTRDPDDHRERINRYLSASKEVAEDLDFSDQLDFEAGLPLPGRRTFLKLSLIHI